MSDRLFDLPIDVFALIATSLSLGDLQRLACVSSSLSRTAAESAAPALLSRHPTPVAFIEACRAGHLTAVQTLAMRLVEAHGSDRGFDRQHPNPCIETREDEGLLPPPMEVSVEVPKQQVLDDPASSPEDEVLSQLLLGVVATSEGGSGPVCQRVLSMATDRLRQAARTSGWHGAVGKVLFPSITEVCCGDLRRL